MIIEPPPISSVDCTTERRCVHAVLGPVNVLIFLDSGMANDSRKPVTLTGENKMSQVTKVNVYHDSNNDWFFAAWCGSEYDCNDSIDDASSQSEAVAWAKAQFPSAEVNVVEPVK